MRSSRCTIYRRAAGISTTLLAFWLLVLSPVTAASADGNAFGTASSLPKTYASALSPADIARLSTNPVDKVIILLRNQHPETPGKASQGASRAALLANDQAHVTNELAALKAAAGRLATDPAVLAVVPDKLVTGPSPAAAAASAAAVPSASAATVTVTAAPGVCP